MDASQIDGEDRLVRTFGYGILAVCPQGKLVAAANGHPPPYVDTISQAEAHAVAVVLENTTSHGQIVTDCLSNLTLLHSGFRAATDPRRRSARTWKRIERAADGCAEYIKLKWVPAHCSWQQARKGVGSKARYISPIEWQCNRAVDELAKKAAALRRAPASVREALASTRQYALDKRARLGAVTYASQNYEYFSTDADGGTVTHKRRDSTGKPPGNLPPHLRSSPQSTEVEPPVTVDSAADKDVSTCGAQQQQQQPPKQSERKKPSISEACSLQYDCKSRRLPAVWSERCRDHAGTDRAEC